MRRYMWIDICGEHIYEEWRHAQRYRKICAYLHIYLSIHPSPYYSMHVTLERARARERERERPPVDKALSTNSLTRSKCTDASWSSYEPSKVSKGFTYLVLLPAHAQNAPANTHERTRSRARTLTQHTTHNTQHTAHKSQGRFESALTLTCQSTLS